METDDLISSFKSANQSLRKRAIALGILMMLAIALSYSESERSKKVSDLIDYQYGLEKVSRLSDSSFHKMIDDEWEFMSKYFSVYHENAELYANGRLFEKVKQNNYDRKLIYSAIEGIDNKIDACNEKQSIGILGLTIPLEPVAYLSLVFVLIMFHDFTQIIIVRNQIYRRIRGQKLPHWKLGFEFFGFYNPGKNASLRYLRFTSSLITVVLIICPLVTSFLMTNLNNSNSLFLFLVNIVCFTLIVIDTMIIFNTENIAGFRYFSNLYLGKHNTSKFKLRLIWAIPLSFILTVNLALGFVITEVFVLSGIIYCLMSLVPPSLLYYALVITQKKPTKRNRAFRAGALLLNLYWLLSTIFVLFSTVISSEHDLDELGGTFIAVMFFCTLYSLIYMKFFMDRRRWDRKPKQQK